MEVLRAGGVIAHATETCYGFACDLTNKGAAEKLFALKHRPMNQAMSALFSSIEEAKRYVEWSDKAEELAQKFLPGPLTLVMRLRTDAPHPLYVTPGGGETIGVRISPHLVALQLTKAFGLPLSTSSANVHGKPNPYSAQDIVEQFEDETLQPDLIIDSGQLTDESPSTIVDLTGKELHILRKGSIDLQ